jgi:hypothetical protein
MRYNDFKLVETKVLAEAKGVFGRNAGDRFVHGDGREYSIVEVVAYPDAQVQRFEDAAARDAAIKQIEAENKITIEWVNKPASNMLAFGLAILDDADSGHVYWGKYLQFAKHDMLGTWGNNQVPPGWQLATKGAQKIQAGYDPQHLIATEQQFSGVESIIKQVESKAPEGIQDIFVGALKDLSQGNGNVVFPGMNEQAPAIRDYFGEIMQPVAMMGGVIGGQAEAAREVLAEGARWSDCKVYWPMAMNAALCDSFLIAPNGQEIVISSKGGSGAKASAKNLFDAAEKARKEGNTELLENNAYTVDIVTRFHELSAKEGPCSVGEYLNIPGITQKLQEEINGYMQTGKSDLEGISEAATDVLAPYNVVQSTKGFNAGYAILSGVAKTVAKEINKNPNFTKGALALLNQSSVIQVYTKMGKRGDDAVLGAFTAVYPPNFEGKILLDGGKNYYSSRVGGKMAFGFD